jgi:hypothetical protein
MKGGHSESGCVTPVLVVLRFAHGVRVPSAARRASSDFASAGRPNILSRESPGVASPCPADHFALSTPPAAEPGRTESTERGFVEMREHRVVFITVEMDRIMYAISNRFKEDWKNHTRNYLHKQPDIDKHLVCVPPPIRLLSNASKGLQRHLPQYLAKPTTENYPDGSLVFCKRLVIRGQHVKAPRLLAIPPTVRPTPNASKGP